MNYAYLHIAVNHVPILGTAFGVFLLLLGYLTKKSDFKKAGLWLFILAGLATIPTYITGDRGAEIVENLPGVVPNFIEPHEEAAEKTAIGLGVLGVLSIIALWLGRTREIPKALVGVILVISLVVSGLCGYTASLGGQIHHEEARKDFKAPEAAPKTEAHAVDTD